MSPSYIVTQTDRDWFGRCRRSWDFGSKSRQGFEPAISLAPFDLDRALRDALAVYYFPGMWTWNRGVVSPLVLKEFERAMLNQRKRYDERAELQLGKPRAAPSSRLPASPVPEAILDAALEQHLEAGHQLLVRYMGWAPEYDLFWPLRVEADFDLHIPDAEHAGLDLATPDGWPIHFEGRVDMLMADQDDARWLVSHRLTDQAFSDVELLHLDETALGSCWGWENDNLIRIAGVLYNELRLSGDPGFRRTAVARSRAEMTSFGQRISATAKAMVAPDADARPHPTPEHCAACAFRAPCLALNEGFDPSDILYDAYRRRPADEWVEGRLGAVSWGMSRGAAPPRFEGGRTRP